MFLVFIRQPCFNIYGTGRLYPVADLGEGPPPPLRLSWVKKYEMTEGRKAGWASKIKPGPSLAQSVDPPLLSLVTAEHSFKCNPIHA